MFSLVREINLLWEPVYPYLARHIAEVYGRTDGTVLEAGPFCGVIYDLARQRIGTSFRIASFPASMEAFYAGEIKKRDMTGMIDTVMTTPALTGVDDASIDLLVFRGALFFPSFFTIDYQAILRVLKPDGTMFAGGGFGKYTPNEVIRPIAERSRKLNLLIGKTEVTVDSIRRDLETNSITENAGIITEGGLWVVVKR